MTVPLSSLYVTNTRSFSSVNGSQILTRVLRVQQIHNRRRIADRDRGRVRREQFPEVAILLHDLQFPPRRPAVRRPLHHQVNRTGVAPFPSFTERQQVTVESTGRWPESERRCSSPSRFETRSRPQSRQQPPGPRTRRLGRTRHQNAHSEIASVTSHQDQVEPPRQPVAEARTAETQSPACR